MGPLVLLYFFFLNALLLNELTGFFVLDIVRAYKSLLIPDK